MQEGAAWVVTYRMALDDSWLTRSTWVRTSTVTGSVERRIESDGEGRWLIDGAVAPRLDGCLDIDLEASALTNAFPVHRLGLGVGEHAAAPAAYVRIDGAAIDQLDQHYRRVDDRGGTQRFDYAAPAFDFTCRLLYDQYGLVVDYPGIATRVG